MKTLLFIVLKVLEIALAVAVYLGLSYLGWLFDIHTTGYNIYVWYHFAYFMFSALGLVLIILLSVLIIPAWIKLNKKWVNDILKFVKKC